MKIIITPIVLGPLMLIGMLSAAAGQPAVAPSSSPSIQLADASVSTPDRDVYIQKAQSDMLTWRKRLHGLGKKAEATGKEADNMAKDDLDKAWVRTEVASQKLQGAGAEDWESAKVSYERSSQDLAHAWDKLRRENK